MRQFTALIFASVMLSAIGCATPVGPGDFGYIPKQAAKACERHCEGLDMTLNSVVIMAGNTGCVCSPKDAPAADSSAAGAASAGGLAAIMVQRQQQLQLQQSAVAVHR